MGSILSLLMGNKSLIIIILMLVVMTSLGVYIKILKSEKAALTSEVEKVKTMLVVSQANVVQLKNDIDFQNSQVDKLKKAADVKKAESAILVKKATQVAETYKQQAADLLKRVAPQNVSKCDAANSLIDGEIHNDHN